MLRRALAPLLLPLALVACRNPDPRGAPGDATLDTGAIEPGEARALAARFLDARQARGIEACRCAGDVDFCHAETIPSLDEDARACLDDEMARFGAGFLALVPCLEAAVDAYVACATPYACPEVGARQACVEAYRDAGEACFASEPSLGLVLEGCLPEGELR